MVAGLVYGVLGAVVSNISTESGWYKPLSIIWNILGFIGSSTFANEGTKQGYEQKPPFTSAKRVKKQK